MIRYDLRCDSGHRFDAWFRGSDAYESQRAAGAVSCAVCGSTAVEKALMAPGVVGRGAETAAKPEAAPALSAPPEHPAARALAALRSHVEKTADYVGRDFAREARRIHLGETERRAIWGEASGAEAKALAEDGVPVAPLPLPRRND